MSVEFCEELFDRFSGRAHLRIGGELAGFDKAEEAVFLQRQGRETLWMPAAKFLSYLSTNEIAELEKLPAFWNGNNEYQPNLTILKAVNAALRRFHKIPVEFEGEMVVERIKDGTVVRNCAG